MKTLNALVVNFLVILVIQSCKKDITIKPIPYEDAVFIECILFPGTVPQVFVSRSLPFFDKDVTPQQVFARGAIVTITENSVVRTLLPDSVYDKFRCRWVPFYRGDIPSAIGNTYTLSVTYDGKTYSASTTISQPKVQIGTIEYSAEFFDLYGGHDGIIISFDDAPGSENYYRYQMNRMIDSSVHHAHVLDVIVNNCTNGELYFATDVGRTVFSDANADGSRLQMYIETAFEYSKDDTAWVFLQSLDKKSAAFYDNLDKQLQAIQNPFIEPVTIKTQIEGCIGIFGSAVMSDSVLFVYPQDHP